MNDLLHQMIAEAALARPDAAAARCAGRELSYEDLVRSSNGLAAVLADTGLQRRDRVAVLLGKGLPVPISFYGTLAAGAALVPIDPRSPAEHVARILQATGATHLVTEPARADVARRALRTSPGVGYVIGADEDNEMGCTTISWPEVESEARDDAPSVATIDLDPSYILHTSGSTGTPKLILHTHRSAMAFIDWAVDEYGLVPSDRLSNHSSHHTCFATFDYYAAARAGATTVILTPAELMMPASLAALLEREGVSVWYSVPTALVHLSLRGNLEARDLRSIRWILFAGESFPGKHIRRIMEQLPNARFSHVYGSTEVNVCTYYHLPESEEIADPLPIGTACSTSETLVVDNQLQLVGEGEVGELLVRGATLMSGYWAEPERNREVLVPRPLAGGFEDVYFRTGDRVRKLPDGNLTFVARSDFQVKIRGHRVELEEVEKALLKLDVVQEAAAFTMEDGESSSILCAAVVVESGRRQTPRRIRAALSDLLPPYAVPEQISILAAMPRTPTGKVDRDALRAAPTEAAAGDRNG